MSVPGTGQTNPFPRKTVVTESIDRIPTYESVAFKEAETKVLEAARRFGTEQNWPGVAIGLRGRFGSGKTHTCLRLLLSFTQQQPMGKTIYGKVQTANRLDLYKNHIGQNLHPEDFQRLISAHILVALRLPRRTGSEETLSGVAEKELRDRIAAEPGLGIEFVREDLLPATDLLQSLQRDVEESARALAADFSTAYSRIPHPLLGKLAIQWLQGNTLIAGEMRDLGVTLPGIGKPEQAWLALRFLLEAFRRAELPFLLCMDEHERVTTRSSDEDRKASWGLLKDLAEVFVGTGHVLIVSGVSEAWDSLPDDVYARIRREDIVEIMLERSEAPKLLRAYAPDLDKIFRPEALERLYDVSENNNARRLLDLAHQAYKVWSLDRRRPLGPEAIRDITRSALGDRNRKASLTDAIEDCARVMSLAIERDAEFRGVRFDFALSTTEGLRILVQVSESAFLLDEIDHGREIIDAQKRLADEHNRIRTCAIMIGYSSFEVRYALEKVVDRVLTYDEAKFRDEFQGFALRALKEMSSEHPPVPVPQIADASRSLDSAEAARSGYVDRVRTALGQASAPQQQRQEELLARQTDEQMAAVLRDVENNLIQESEHLIRLNSSGVFGPYEEVALRGVGYVNAQHEGLRRARNVCEREGAGALVANSLEAYRVAMAQAEDAWQNLVNVNTGSVQPEFAARIRESLARRRVLIHDIEERWLRRRRRTAFSLLNLPSVIPLAVAVLLIAWLGVDYWQSSSARQQAFDGLRKALTGLFEFALGGAGLDKKDFASRVLPFEKAVLNPALPQDDRYEADLRKAIKRVETGYQPDYKGHLGVPDQPSLDSLREVAGEALKSTYSTRAFLPEYVLLHGPAITIALLLLVWGIGWPYFAQGTRWWLRRIARR